MDKPQKVKVMESESGWKNHPDFPTLILSNCAVATSGDTNQFLEIGWTSLLTSNQSQNGC